ASTEVQGDGRSAVPVSLRASRDDGLSRLVSVLGARTEGTAAVRPLRLGAAMNEDPDAIEIGALYRKGREAIGDAQVEGLPPERKPRRVTPIRLFSGKLSGSRNGELTRGGNWTRSIDATVCHWCDTKFMPGQMRYPILDDICTGWGVVSICLECFKTEDSS